MNDNSNTFPSADTPTPTNPTPEGAPSNAAPVAPPFTGPAPSLEGQVATPYGNQTPVQNTYGQAPTAYGQATSATQAPTQNTYGQAPTAYGQAASATQAPTQNTYGQAPTAYGQAASTTQAPTQNTYGQAPTAYGQAASTTQAPTQNTYGQAPTAYGQAASTTQAPTQNAHGQAQAPYSQATDGSQNLNAYGQPADGTQNAYGQAQAPYSQADDGSQNLNAYGQPADGTQNAYGQYDAQNPYGQAPYGQPGYGVEPAKPKKKLAPLFISLGAIVVAVGVFFALWASPIGLVFRANSAAKKAEYGDALTLIKDVDSVDAIVLRDYIKLITVEINNTPDAKDPEAVAARFDELGEKIKAVETNRDKLNKDFWPSFDAILADHSAASDKLSSADGVAATAVSGYSPVFELLKRILTSKGFMLREVDNAIATYSPMSEQIRANFLSITGEAVPEGSPAYLQLSYLDSGISMLEDVQAQGARTEFTPDDEISMRYTTPPTAELQMIENANTDAATAAIDSTLRSTILMANFFNKYN